jgi:hypothetical protein
MRNKTDRISCTKICDAKLEDCSCMWLVNEKLIELAHDKKYGMCEYLRAELLKRESEVSGNEYDG